MKTFVEMTWNDPIVLIAAMIINSILLLFLSLTLFNNNHVIQFNTSYTKLT